MVLDIPKLRDDFRAPHHLITTSDNQTLFLRKWEPEKKPRNTAILLFHGITAYSGPYEIIVKPMVDLGFTVYGLDLRGHGLSDGNRGDSPSLERYVMDLCESISFVRQLHPKVAIFGHSLGVLSSLLALSSCRNNIDGVALLSGSRTTRPSAYPSMSLIKKLKIAFSHLTNPSKPVIQYYREGMVGLDDPLFNFKYTFRFMKIVSIRDFEFPDMQKIPVFVGIGDKDELFSVESCRLLYDEIPSENKMFHIGVGGKHSVFPPGSMNPLGIWFAEQFD